MDVNIIIIVSVVVASISFIGFLIGRYIYRLIHHLPTGDCACCHKNSKKLLKEYHKKYGCCCNK